MGRKLTRHNGRSGKNGVYNVKHNDRRFDVGNSEHIDPERTKENLYWDCYDGLYRHEDRDDHMSFEEVEKRFYEENYLDFTLAQNARNEARRHPEKNRTPDDLRKDKRTCPEETVYQMGTMGDSESPETLRTIAEEFFEKFRELFGEHVHMLDWALHLDETTPHIQERHVFDCENKYGELAPQQEKALELMKVPLPKPDENKWKYNNRKMTFDAACRTMLFDICKSHGVYLDEEPVYGGRAYLEKQEYILMKQKEELAEQDQALQSQELKLAAQGQAIRKQEEKLEEQGHKIAEQELKIGRQEEKLEAILIRIEDTESFVEEVADAAYEKAVDAVTQTTAQEVGALDLAIMEEEQKKILKDPKLTDKGRAFAGKLFGNLHQKFKEAAGRIPDRMKRLFRSSAVKEKIKEPIRVSIREQLKQGQREADAYNARRQKERGPVMHNRQKNMEL